MTQRLADTFSRARAEARPALITLVIPGYPTPAETDTVFDAMVAGGADIVEVEIPFSDPLADGTTIQRAAEIALNQGITPADCLDFARRARGRHRVGVAPDSSVRMIPCSVPKRIVPFSCHAVPNTPPGGRLVMTVGEPPSISTRFSF